MPASLLSQMLVNEIYMKAKRTRAKGKNFTLAIFETSKNTSNEDYILFRDALRSFPLDIESKLGIW